LSRRMSQHTFS